MIADKSVQILQIKSNTL